MSSQVVTLYEDEAKTNALYPRTKVSAISDDDGKALSETISELNNNIVKSDIGVGKNILDLSDVDNWTPDHGNFVMKTFQLKPNTNYTISMSEYLPSVVYFNEDNSIQRLTTKRTDSTGLTTIEVDKIKIKTINVQIEEGSQVTEYEPYIKSLKQLTNSALNMDLLWTNASPTSEFASQTINLDLSGYKQILIKFKVVTKSVVYNDVPTQIFTFENVPQRLRVVICHTNFQYRVINILTNGINFSNGEYCLKYGEGTVNTSNASMIPLEIYGVK